VYRRHKKVRLLAATSTAKHGNIQVSTVIRLFEEVTSPRKETRGKRKGNHNRSQHNEQLYH